MKRILLFLLAAAAAIAQQRSNIITVIPITNATTGAPSAGGEIRFEDLGTHYVGLKGPTSVSTNIVWELPAVDGSTGKCWGWASAATLGWVTCGGAGLPIDDSLTVFSNHADPTKLLKVSLASLTTGTTRTITFRDANYTVAGTDLDNNFSISQHIGTGGSGVDLLPNGTVNLGSTAGGFNLGYFVNIRPQIVQWPNPNPLLTPVYTMGQNAGELVLANSLTMALMTWNAGGQVTSNVNFAVAAFAGGGAIQPVCANNFGVLFTATCPAAGSPFTDASAILFNAADNTKLLKFALGGFTTGTTRTLTPQDASYVIAGTNIDNLFSGNNTFTANTGFQHAVIFSNNISSWWLDSGGSPIPFLLLGSDDNFNVGAVGATATSGRGNINFWEQGNVRMVLNNTALLPNGTVDLGSTAGGFNTAYLVASRAQTVEWPNANPLLTPTYNLGQNAGVLVLANSLATPLMSWNGGGQVTSNVNFAIAGFSGGGATQPVCANNSGVLFTASCISGLADPGGNGLLSRTALNTTINRTLTGSSPITVTNGDGVSGNPTVACSTCLVTGGGQTVTGTDTYTASILSNGSASIGGSGAGQYFANGLFGTSVEAPKVRVIDGNPASISDFFDLTTDGTTGTFKIKNSSNAPVFQYLAGGGGSFTFAGALQPGTSNTYDIGTSSNIWRNIFASSITATIYDVPGGFFGQTTTTAALSKAAGGSCQLFFAGGILYASTC